MLLTEPIDAISDQSSWVFEHLPEIVVRFIKVVIDRIEIIFGITIFMYIPTNLNTSNRNVWSVVKKLEKLKKLGVIKNYHTVTKKFDDEPHLKSVQVELVNNNKNNSYGYGRSWYNQDEAWGPAFGEAVERWCVDHFSPNKTTVLGIEEISKSLGYPLKDLPGFSDKMRSASKHYELTDKTTFSCVTAKNLINDNKNLVPLQWFSFQHVRDYVYQGKEPLLAPPITTGAAAGRTYEEALLNALLENIERDAFIIHWLRKITPVKIDVRASGDRELNELMLIADRYGLEVHFLKLETDFPVSVIACVVVDRSGIGPAVNIDACAGVSQRECIIKSFQGSIGMRQYARRRYEQFKNLGQILAIENLDMQKRMIWWSDVKRLPDLEFILTGPVVCVEESNNSESRSQTIDRLVGYAKQKKYDVFVVDITPAAIAKASGLTVLFVKLPLLQPLYLEESLKAWKGDRLWSIPDDLDLKIGTTTINQIPHPFT